MTSVHFLRSHARGLGVGADMRSGFGLGLSIADELAERSGGLAGARESPLRSLRA